MSSLFGVSYQAGGRFDFPYFPTKTVPYIKGERLRVDGSYADVTYVVPEDMELLTVSVGASRYADKDYWSLLVNNEKIMDTIYTKDVPEGFYFMVVKEVKKDQEITLQFFNESGSGKTVWMNFQFLKD